MEKKALAQADLESLFDFQRFWKNPHLEALAEETANRYCLELSDEELTFVSAAGEPETMGSAGNLFQEGDGRDG